MKLTKMLAFALLVGCMPLAAFADGVDFSNSGGTITASGGNSLTLSGSTLTQASGIGLDSCGSAAACGNGGMTPGTVTFNTGTNLVSGSPSGNATWGPGGTITITGNASSVGGGPFTFTGSFSMVTWTETTIGSLAYWTFNGTISDGTLMGTGGTTMGYYGGNIEITFVQQGSGTWQVASGDTGVVQLTPVPEPSTLTLLGGGLVGVAILARRRLSKKANTPH